MTVMNLPDDLLTTLLDPRREGHEVPAGVPFDLWRLRALSPEEFEALGAAGGARLSPTQLAYLASLALLAPTTHNTVPQRFRLGDDGALGVWLDRRAVLTASDAKGRQATISLGCAVASAAQGARAVGWEAEVEVLPVSSEALEPHREGEPAVVEVARLHFKRAAGPAPEPVIELILRRKVVRAEYDERVKLDEATAEELHAIARRRPGCELYLVRDTPTLFVLGKFQELADATVLNREDFARELGDWLIENDSPSFVGMRGIEFGLSDEVARRMHRGLLGMGPILPDEIAGVAKSGSIAMRSSSAVGIVTVEKDDVPSRIAAGAIYDEMALRLAARGFSTAMHAAITEVDAPNLALRGRLRTRARPNVVFRIGRPLKEADALRPHSSRPPLASVLV